MSAVPSNAESAQAGAGRGCRPRAALLALAASLLLAVLGALALGSRPTPPMALLEALLAARRDELVFIVQAVRLPRVLLALLVGAALAVAGLVLQALVRNPLASPDVIGITGGASVAAVLYLTIVGAAGGTEWLPLAAMVGAGGVALLIVALAWRGGIAPARLVLVGIGIAAAMGALTTLLIVLNPDTTALQAYLWLTGSLYAAEWRDVRGLLPWVLVFVPLVLAYARHMDVLALGDDAAAGLGIDVNRCRCVLLFASVALAGSAVAFAGGLAFVGLIAPHLARGLLRSGHRNLVWGAAMIGALILLAADTLGRVAFLPRDLPAGIFVSGIGAVFFVFLLYRLRR